MAKFYGEIGYGETVETRSGIAEDEIIERKYSGDVLRNSRRSSEGEKVNDDLSVGNSISILADAYLNENFHNMKYVKWMGTRWKPANIDVEHPRLIIRLGGVYNGQTPPTP